LEDQIALGEVENKGLDHLQHASRGEFQVIEAMKGRRIEKVRGTGEGKHSREEGLRFTAGS